MVHQRHAAPSACPRRRRRGARRRRRAAFARRRGANETGETGADAMEDEIDSSDANERRRARFTYGGDRDAYGDGGTARADDALGGASWSPEAVARLVGLLPDALFFEQGLREQWADEARRWLLRAASFPLAAASARVLAAPRPAGRGRRGRAAGGGVRVGGGGGGGPSREARRCPSGGGFSARTGPGPAGVGGIGIPAGSDSPSKRLRRRRLRALGGGGGGPGGPAPGHAAEMVVLVEGSARRWRSRVFWARPRACAPYTCPRTRARQAVGDDGPGVAPDGPRRRRPDFARRRARARGELSPRRARRGVRRRAFRKGSGRKTLAAAAAAAAREA